MKLALCILIITILTSGCATTVHRDWTATGGSRSDGIVRLSVVQREFENVQVNEQQALRLARQRCQAWGYSGAQAFGGTRNECLQWGGVFVDCAVLQVNREFQCTGQPAGN